MLRKCIRETQRNDKSFTGTPYAVAHRSGANHQQIINLLSGSTVPWNLTVKTAFGMAQALDGLTIHDFAPPDSVMDLRSPEQRRAPRNRKRNRRTAPKQPA